MGAGASTATTPSDDAARLAAASAEELRRELARVPAATRKKLKAALATTLNKASEAQLPAASEDADTEEMLPKSKWDELGCSSLKEALKSTVMIDAAWLAELADKNGVLPRCQDVPASAKVSLAEMEAWDKDEYTVGALVISYPWLAANHPDPHGEQLRKIAFVLKAFAAEAREHKGCRVGVFWE